MALKLLGIWAVLGLLCQVWAAVARPLSGPGFWFYQGALVLQQLAVACQGALTLRILDACHVIWTQGLMAGLTGAIFVALAFDAWLYGRYALRLQADYLRLLRNLHLFHPRWRLLTAAVLASMTALSGAVFMALTRLAAPPEVFDTSTYVALVPLLWGLAALSWRHIPAPYTFQYSQRLFAWQQAAWHRARRRHQARTQDTFICPELFRARHEQADSIDPAFPLFRQVQRFTGPTHFDLRLEPQERPHVVMIFMESFAGREVGVLGGMHGVTPCFDAWSNKGILWRQFYANGTSTARGALASLYGAPPRFTQTSAQADQPPNLIGLADLFNKRGYHSAFFHNGPAYFEAKNPFFFDHGYCTFFSNTILRKVHPRAAEGVWGPHDEYLMKFHLDWLERQQALNLPSFSTLFTVSNHEPFTVPPHFLAKPEPQDNLPHGEVYKNFLRTTLYSDACLGLYLDGLAARGLSQNTVVVVTADTGQQWLDTHGEGLAYAGRLTAEAARIPLLILADGRLPGGQVIDEAGSQLDLMPTIMDLFSMHEAHHGVGTSLRRVCSDRRPLLVGCYEPQFLATYQKPWHASYLFDSSTQALYNTADDPREEHDMSRSHPARNLVAVREAQSARQFIDHMYDANIFAPAHASTSFPFPRYPTDASGQPPTGYPLTLDDVRRRLASLKMHHEGVDALRELRFLQIYLGSNLTEQDTLLAAQLQYKVIYYLRTGVLTEAELAEKVRINKLLGF